MPFCKGNYFIIILTKSVTLLELFIIINAAKLFFLDEPTKGISRKPRGKSLNKKRLHPITDEDAL